MSRTANGNGDGPPPTSKTLVRPGAYWDIAGFEHRVELLNELRSIDRHSSTYLELADLLDKWRAAPWQTLPQDVRYELDSKFGVTRDSLKAAMKTPKWKFMSKTLKAMLSYRRPREIAGMIRRGEF